VNRSLFCVIARASGQSSTHLDRSGVLDRPLARTMTAGLGAMTQLRLPEQSRAWRL